MKILSFYLLTSIVCWTPLQFTIIYRHFRDHPIAADWFFELSFFSQLCASLSAAMNPIIFGFLSQPFRRIVVRSWLFRLLDKLWAGGRRPPAAPPKAADNGAQNNGGGGEPAMSNRPVALANPQARLGGNSNRATCCSPSGPRATHTRNDADHSPKLTIEYVDHQHLQRQQSTLGRSAERWACAGHQHRRRTQQQRPKSTIIVSQHQRRSAQGRHNNTTSVQRSHSSTASGAKQHLNAILHGNGQNNKVRHSKTEADGERGQSNGIENKAYARAADEEEAEEGEANEGGRGELDLFASSGHATTSFMVQNGGITQAVK